MNKIVFIALITLTAATAANAQIAQGGVYRLEQAVIAGGGTSADSTGSVYKLNGVIGEPVAGTTSSAGIFSVKGGFLNAPSIAPTAAGATVSGRVRMASGKGIRNVHITLITADGTTRTTLSGVGGNYSFTDVAAGQTVILSAAAKRFGFNQPTQVLNIAEDADGIDFIGIEQWFTEEAIPIASDNAKINKP